jgi:SnoaL-like domain
MPEHHETATRESAFDTLLAKQAITEVLHRYCYAMDTNDRQLGYDVWHPDGTAHYEGMFEGLGSEFIDFGQGGHEASFGGTSHQLTNVLIDVNGDRATSWSYVTAAARVGQAELLYVIRGRYHDQWSCREGTWRIDSRHFTTDVWHVAPLNHHLMQPDPAESVEA